MSKYCIFVWTNYCGHSEFDGAETTAEYRNVVDLAKTKVADAKDVVISSVLPRTASTDYQQNGLCAVVRGMGVTFIFKDNKFQLGNESPHDGYNVHKRGRFASEKKGHK